jgi:hypothetical protein
MKTAAINAIAATLVTNAVAGAAQLSTTTAALILR